MKLTRLLAIVMALCLLAAALPLASAEEEDITLTIARKTDTLIENLETNETTKAIEEKFGVKLKFLEYPSADAQAKLAVVMASKSNVPDIINFELDYVTEYNYAMRGLLLPLNEYLADPSMTKNLDSRVDAEAKEALLKIVRMPDGNNYGLPSYEDSMWGRAWYHAWINQEWLDALGLDMPKTTEDFRAVLEAFVSQDPNGNGVNDEIGLLGSTTSDDQKVVNFLLNAFTYADPNAKYFGVKDGEVYAAFVQDAFKEGLEYVHSLVEAGLIYAGSFTQDQTQMRAIINQDGDYVVGSVTAGSAGHWNGVSSNPNLRKMTELEPLTGPDGVCWTPTSEPSCANYWYITSACEHPELAFAIGESFYDFETSLTQRYGVKEVDWTNDPAKMDNYFFEYGVTGEDRIFAIMNDSAWTNVNNVTWRNTTPHIFDHALDMSWAIETVENYESGVSLVFRPDFYVRYVPHMNNEIIGKLNYTAEEAERIADISTAIDSYVNESITAFVTGIKDFSEWDAYLAELEKMHLEDYIAVQQAAYDRKHS